MKREPVTQSDYQAARERLHARVGGHCRGCRRILAAALMHAHHRLPRSAGRDDSDVNLLAFCFACHAWTHANPKRARELGWIVRRGQSPADVPVLDAPELLAWRPRCR